MLVLNRRLGESIVIADDIEVCVLAIADHKVWLSIDAPGVERPVCVSAVAVSDDEARLEVGAPESVAIGADEVHVEVAGADHPSTRSRATVAVNRLVGQSVTVGGTLRVRLASVARGHPCLAIEGPGIGSDVRLTLIRPVGSYVRIGVDAPNRRIFRKELRDELTASTSTAGAGAGADLVP